MTGETLHIAILNSTLIRILALGFLGFTLNTLLTPVYTTIAYRFEWWKRQRTETVNGEQATVYQKLHAAKHKRLIPTMAGMVFVVAILLITLPLNLSRGETWLPLAGMFASGLIGLLDDFMNIRGSSGIAGMRAKTKFALNSLVALAGGWWFYAKLGITHINIPGFHEIYLGVFVILLFWFVVIATANAVNISDGLDGLAGGLLTTSFLVYTIICVVEGRFVLAGFCMTVVGALLSYTWFNIYPARFFMGDVGAFAIGTALGVIAMQTDTVFILPVIGGVYVIETGSVIINRVSRKLRNGKKVFLSSPLHHHLEAIGWPETKVTMRFWIIGQIVGILGLMLFLVEQHT
jgi:phospho-N-acetylmuramoyl-pentapeptide-transferase